MVGQFLGLVSGDWPTPKACAAGAIMNLLFRYIRFLTILTFRISVRLVAFIFHLLLPIVLRILGLLQALIHMSFTATVQGPAQYTDRLASQWTRRLLDSGADRANIDEIYRFCRFLVGALIVLGWVVSGSITVEILRIVFGFFT
jgi:hypothetical protein